MTTDHRAGRPPAIVVPDRPRPRALDAGDEIAAEQRRLRGQLDAARAKLDLQEAKHRGLELDFHIWLGLVRDQARTIMDLIEEDPNMAREALDRMAISVEGVIGAAAKQ
jgi:hypothetical protein